MQLDIPGLVLGGLGLALSANKYMNVMHRNRVRSEK